MQSLTAFNLQQWIDDHRDRLRPPVCNQQVFEEDDFIVMIVGGPNSRDDYHIDEGPELFYQLEGDMLLKTIQDGVRANIPIGEGEMLLLPPCEWLPHRPLRPPRPTQLGRRPFCACPHQPTAGLRHLARPWRCQA